MLLNDRLSINKTNGEQVLVMYSINNIVIFIRKFPASFDPSIIFNN